MATVAKVAVQAATYAIDKVYDYLLPPELAGLPCAGALRTGKPPQRGGDPVPAAGGAGQAAEGGAHAAGRGADPHGKGAAADAVDDAAVFLHILRCAADGASHGGVVSLPGDVDAGART